MPRSKNPDAKPRGVHRGEARTPGSARKTKGEEPRNQLVSGKVSKTVKDMIAAAGETDGEGIEKLIRQLLDRH